MKRRVHSACRRLDEQYLTARPYITAATVSNPHDPGAPHYPQQQLSHLQRAVNVHQAGWCKLNPRVDCNFSQRLKLIRGKLLSSVAFNHKLRATLYVGAPSGASEWVGAGRWCSPRHMTPFNPSVVSVLDDVASKTCRAPSLGMLQRPTAQAVANQSGTRS